MGQGASAKKAKTDASKVSQAAQLASSRAPPTDSDLQSRLDSQQNALSNLPKSSRSFKFILFNNSSYSLSLSDFRLSQNCMWMTSPPGDLLPGEFGVFGAVTETEVFHPQHFTLSGQFTYHGTLVGEHTLKPAALPLILQNLLNDPSAGPTEPPKPAPGVLTSPPQPDGRFRVFFSAHISSSEQKFKGSSLGARFHPLKDQLEAHPSFLMEIFEAEVISKRTLTPTEIDALVESTYFTSEEIVALYDPFKFLAGEDEQITEAEFNSFLPEMSDPEVRQAVFSGFDKSRSFDYQVTFEEFVCGLSAACRGNLQDKATFVFNMFSSSSSFRDENSAKSTNSNVGDLMDPQRSNAPKFPQTSSISSTPASPSPPSPTTQSSQSFDAHQDDLDDGYHSDDSHEQTEPKPTPKHHDHLEVPLTESSAAVVVGPGNAHMIRAGSEVPVEEEAETLNLKDFISRCKTEPDLASCFGLFDFFNGMMLVPIVKLIQSKHQVSTQVGMVGWLNKNSGSKRFVVLRGGFLGYSKGPGQPLTRVIPLAEAHIKPSSSEKHSFTLTAPYFERKFSVGGDESEAQRWITALRAHINEQANRFNSFAPIRENHCGIATFVNGKEYFDALVPILLGAQRSIYISGWYFSPGVYLKRGSFDTLNKFRLDKVLLEAANRGVKIHVLIYGSLALPEFDLGSDYVAQYLNNLHANIYCIRHPNQAVPSVWTHHQKLVVADDSIAFVGGLDLAYGRYDDSDYRVVDEDGIHFPGRDYFNSFWKGENNGPTKESVLDRFMYTRMPWCDMQIQVDGLAAHDVSVNFIQRWNHAVRDGTKELKAMNWIFPLQSLNYEGSPAVVIDAATGIPIDNSDNSNMEPKNSASVDKESAGRQLTNSSGAIPTSSLAWDSQKPQTTVKLPKNQLRFSGCKIQAIRSVSSWSAGVSCPESSIYKAYLDLIENAESFIYIQNQFFISSIEEPSPKNRLLDSLYKRIQKAIRNQELFKVLIVLPTVPGGGPVSLGSTKFLLKYTFAAISRGGHSLLEKLAADFPQSDLSQYISFATPRQIGRMGPYLMSEPVYVHAKVLIVDDKRAIVSSANINDRSFRGTRDSELGFVFESGSSESIDCITTPSGKQVEVCKAVHDFRVRMWCDLMGIKPSHSDYTQQLALIQDPVSGFAAFMQRAQENTKWYRQIFPGKMPEDVLTAADFKLTTNSVGDDVDAATIDLRFAAFDKIRGLICAWPGDFMKEDPLHIGLLEKESVVPKIVFM